MLGSLIFLSSLIFLGTGSIFLGTLIFLGTGSQLKKQERLLPVEFLPWRPSPQASAPSQDFTAPYKKCRQRNPAITFAGPFGFNRVLGRW